MRTAAVFEATGMDIARANPVTLGLLSFRSIAEFRRRSRNRGASLNAHTWTRPSVLEAAPVNRQQQPARQLQAYDAGNRDTGRRE
jgi:hypothetical protein